MTHTPGPWRVDNPNRICGVITDKNGPICGMVYSDSRGITLEQSHANARLIAAAPDGLAFAHAALDCLKTLANGTTDEIDTMRRNLRGSASIIQQGQDFIAKAQGKENPET